MPKLTSKPPKYRHHKGSGQAFVTLGGQDFYLDSWRSKASRIEYDRLIGEWMQNGRRLPETDDDLTVTELAAAYWRYAKCYYVKNGRPTGELGSIRSALRPLTTLYGRTRATDFGPLALKAIRRRMIDEGLARTTTNMNTGRIRRAFKWAASEEMTPASVAVSLATVSGLRREKTDARETSPVLPVTDATIDATLPHLPPIVADMVCLHRHTGCRPGEVCMIRPCDVDTSGEVWSYRPESHKTEHHGRERVIFIGPRGQDVLRPYLLRDKSARCFAPVESERRRNAERRANRRSPMTPSQRRRRAKRNRRRSPGGGYDVNSSRRAIHRACDKAGIDRWSPNRLRHAAATEIRRRFGLEAAQVALGHSQADVTQIYAERDLALAAGSGDLLRAMHWQGFCEGKAVGLFITPGDAEPTTEQVGEAEVVSVGRESFRWPRLDEKVSARFQAALTLLRETLGMRPAPAGAWFVPTSLQADILDAVDGKALKKDALAVEVCGGEGTRLYKPGAIKQLREAGLVADRKGVGYYRPDAPPSGTVWLRNQGGTN